MVAGSGRGGLRGLLRMQQQPAAQLLGGEMIAANAASLEGRQRVECASRCQPDQRAEPLEVFKPNGVDKRSAKRAGRAPGGRRRQNSFLCDDAGNGEAEGSRDV